MRTSGTASVIFCSLKPLAMIFIKYGVNKFTRSVKTPIKSRNLMKISA